MKSFKELDTAIKVLKHVMKQCEDQKPTYINTRDQALEKINALDEMLKKAVTKYKKKEEDTEEELNEKVKKIAAVIKKANKDLSEVNKLKSSLDRYTKDLLAGDLPNAQRTFFRYRQFRDDLKSQLMVTKVDIATDITQLKSYLEKKNAGSNTIGAIADFLAKLKAFSLYETTEQNSKELIDAFKAATKHRIGNTGAKAKKGMDTKWADPLKNILKEAEEYTIKSGQYWAKCHRLRDTLEDGAGYAKAIRTEIDVKGFEKTLAQKKGASMESIRRLSERLKRYLPEGKGEKLLEEINGPSGAEKILAFAQKYNLKELVKYLQANQVKEKIDINGGGNVGQPEVEAKFPLVIKTPDCKAEIPIPGFEYGVITGGFEIGAGVQASIAFNGALKYTPFGDTILETAVEVKGELKAEIYFGVFLELCKIIKATAKAVLGASAGVSVAMKHKLTRALIQNFDRIALTGSAEFKFEIEGHLEFVLGLSPALKIMLSAFEFNPELKFQSPKLVLLEAKREGAVTLDVPLNGESNGFPRKVLSLSDGGWEVTFVAKEALSDFIDKKFGGLDKLKSVMDENPLSQDKLDELTNEYSVFGKRATV